MPPIPDRNLEQRIVNAALRLCRARGEKGLTLRAVARAAGTTTPTVYKRFRNKEALRIALARHVRQELLDEVFASSRLEEVYRRYLRFGEERPKEYGLMAAVWSEVFSAEEAERPGEVWFRERLAERFGGSPEEYTRAYYAFLLLCHGTASVINMAPDKSVRERLRENCIAIGDALMQNVNILRPAAPGRSNERAAGSTPEKFVAETTSR